MLKIFKLHIDQEIRNMMGNQEKLKSLNARILSDPSYT